MEIFLKFVSLVDLKPSTFVHVVTESDRVHETPEMINQLAELGKFPKLIDLWPSIIVAVALSLCRMALQRFIFKVFFFLFDLLTTSPQPLISRILQLDVLELPPHPILDKAFKTNNRPSVHFFSTHITLLSLTDPILSCCRVRSSRR
jgi:hypothetical protein